jgi:molybdate-binding protein
VKKKHLPNLMTLYNSKKLSSIADLCTNLYALALSLDGLLQYKSGRYDIAGFHLPEGKLGKGVLPRIRRLINSETDTLLYALRRQQGLMLVPGNPKGIQGLADLVRTDVKFINRQRNSGSRVTLDAILQQAGLDNQKINGYVDEEFTHSAVAAIVASGVAECGFGLEAAAAQFNLAFIPLNWESYWFVLPTKQVDSSVMQQFIALLGSDEFTQSVVHLSGYDTKRSGTLVVLDKDLAVLL